MKQTAAKLSPRDALAYALGALDFDADLTAVVLRLRDLGVSANVGRRGDSRTEYDAEVSSVEGEFAIQFTARTPKLALRGAIEYILDPSEAE